jgi:superfamily II DNA or RNA helicase
MNLRIASGPPGNGWAPTGEVEARKLEHQDSATIAPEGKHALELRPYQRDALDGVMNAWREFDRLLGVAPTGSGKTILFANVIEQRLSDGPCLVIAHRDELLQHARDKMYAACAIKSQLEKADAYASLDAPVVVGSVQSLARRVERFPTNHFRTLIVDEAHRTLADSYLRVLNHFPEAKVLGVTATPDRGDKKSLSRFYQAVAFEVGLLDLITANYLSRIRIQTVPLQIDITNITKRAGDYADEDIGNALDPLLERLADEIASHAGSRKAIIFTPLVRTAERLASLLTARRLAAEAISGESPNRAQILERFRRGETRMLANAMLLTEGYDEPSIDCVIVLRPTRVRSLYAQMVGRGTRIHPGKSELLLLDFLWLSGEHDLVSPANLIAETEAEAERIQQAISDGCSDLLEARDTAARDYAAVLRARIEQAARRKAQSMDLVEFVLSLGSPQLTEYEPVMRWECEPVTDRQREVLSKAGLDPSSIRCKGQASAIIDKLFLRRRLNLATARQVLALIRLHHPNPHRATFEEASRFLGQRFSNH